MQTVWLDPARSREFRHRASIDSASVNERSCRIQSSAAFALAMTSLVDQPALPDQSDCNPTLLGDGSNIAGAVQDADNDDFVDARKIIDRVLRVKDYAPCISEDNLAISLWGEPIS